jgi:hypothetical protein
MISLLVQLEAEGERSGVSLQDGHGPILHRCMSLA